MDISTIESIICFKIEISYHFNESSVFKTISCVVLIAIIVTLKWFGYEFSKNWTIFFVHKMIAQKTTSVCFGVIQAFMLIDKKKLSSLPKSMWALTERAVHPSVHKIEWTVCAERLSVRSDRLFALQFTTIAMVCIWSKWYRLKANVFFDLYSHLWTDGIVKQYWSQDWLQQWITKSE